MGFLEKLSRIREENDSLLCVGLDAEIGRMPRDVARSPEPLFAFNRAIVDATVDLVCAYKLNAAFYEAEGSAGWKALADTIAYIPDGVPVIVDAKRGDIGNTARMYARSVFETLGADAITANPYMGSDAIEPFLDYPNGCVFVLCLTSNPSGSELQKLVCEGKPVYQHVAERTVTWSRGGSCGLVVGATQADELESIRRIAPELPILIPGIGAQGGDLASSVRLGTDGRDAPTLISSSRAILYASEGTDFPEAARGAASRLREEIKGILDFGLRIAD